MKTTYYQVFEYSEEPGVEKRRIYTFDNETLAHDMVEFILRTDTFKPNIGIEEHEVTTGL